MIIAIHQPNYLPWLGYFDKADQVDMFVFLDHVQFVRKDFHHRNRIKTPAGPSWLSVPCIHTGARRTLVEQGIAYETKWTQEHWRLLKTSYASAPFCSLVFDCLESAYACHFESIAELNIALVMKLAGLLGLKCHWMRSSTLGLAKQKKSELLAAICHQLGASEYLSGQGARSYLDYEPFDRASVSVKWQAFRHPMYQQCWMTQGFVTGLSLVDLIANEGPRAGKILRSTRTFEMPVPMAAQELRHARPPDDRPFAAISGG